MCHSGLQQNRQSIEFTEENVSLMLGSLLGSGQNICEAAVVEAFDLMTKYYDENRVHWEGWKTNEYWRVNKRFILPRVIDSRWTQWNLNYTTAQNLDDIDRGLCLLEGVRYDEIMTITKALRESLENDGESGSIASSHFFEIRYYKKGTAHFLFRDLDVWERFNVAACKGKKWLPGTAA